MNNGRENRTNGNEEEGEKEKEALRSLSTKSKRGTQIASPKFLWDNFSDRGTSQPVSVYFVQGWKKGLSGHWTVSSTA